MNSIEKTIDKNQQVADKIDECIEKSKIKAYDIVKRFIDIIVGLIGCICLLPLIVVVKIANMLTKDFGSVFFVQKRIGKNGKTFKFYKFRTMVLNADKKLKKLLDENEDLKEEYEINKKMKNDPRITKIGRFLRKTSLDETSQFINILKGDMSLVGNRPYLMREKKEMGKYFKDIVKTKPGLTGLWQVSGRSDVSFKRRLVLERKYSQEYCLKMDLKILIGTVKEVFKGNGAV